MTTAAPPLPISVKQVARSVRFKHHPTLSACWIWTGPRAHHGGVPMAFYNGVTDTARRAVWRRYRGEVPEGRNLTVICREQLCVSPEHVAV